MATTSTIPAFKKTLKANLAARSALKKVLVTWGWPKSPSKEMVLIGDAKGEQRTVAMRPGRHVRGEQYELEIVIYVEQGGTDQQSVTERAHAIAAEIENELRDDPTVGATVQSAVIGGPFSLEERANPNGQSRVAILTFTVETKARLT